MTRTAGRFVTLATLLAALFLALAASASAVTLTPTGAPLAGSDFQGGDGDQDSPGADVSDPPDGVTDVDWQSIAEAVASGLDPTDEGDSAFVGGNKESAPGNWAFTTEGDGVNPNKDNLLAAWSESRASASGAPNTFLNLAFTREAQTGNTFITFELNQEDRSWFNGNTDITCRTTNDLLISYEVASGGSPPNVDVVVYRWITDSFDANGSGCAAAGHFQALDPQGDAEAAVNKDAIWNYLPGLPEGFLAAGTFGEASLNLTGILTALGLSPCESFSQASMHTRSSTSIDSQLQDYIGPVPLGAHGCGIEITKTGDDLTHDGDHETFGYEVTNTGTQPVALDKETGVVDDRCAPVVYDGGDANGDGMLDLGETWSFSCDYEVAHDDENEQHEIINTVTASGAVGDLPVSDSATWTTLVIHPAIDVEKSVAEESALAGATLHYAIVVTNTGDTGLEVTPSDAGCDGFDDSAFHLDPGAERELVCTKVVGEGVDAVDNTASASGADQLGGQVSDESGVSTPIVEPRLQIEKTGPAHAYDGDTIAFGIAVSNPGTAPVFDVRLGDLIQGTDHGCDSLSRPSGDTGDDAVLDTGETWQYTCSYTVRHGDEDATKHVVNVATVEGTNGDGGSVGPVSDDALVLILHPAIAIDKSGPPTAQAGDRVGYVLTVTNPGDEALAEATMALVDEQCNGDPVTLLGKGGDQTAATLDPGDAWTFSCSVQTNLGDSAVHNVAAVTAADQFGKAVGASDDADTTLTQPEQLVLPERIVPGRAQLLGPTGCQARTFSARVRGSQIAMVVFALDGNVVKRLHRPNAKGLYVLRVNPKKMRAGVHRIVANVVFKPKSGTRPRTLRLSFQRCAKALRAPRFTG